MLNFRSVLDFFLFLLKQQHKRKKKSLKGCTIVGLASCNFRLPWQNNAFHLRKQYFAPEALLTIELHNQSWETTFFTRCCLRARRFWAIDDNQKWNAFLLTFTGPIPFVLFYALAGVKTICSKIWAKPLPKNKESPFPVDIHRYIDALLTP